MRKSNFILLLSVLIGLLAGGSVAPLRAQAPEPWDEPVNLSRSGAASDPMIVAGPGGILQAIWWDDFDGLTTAIYSGGAWSEPQIAPIITYTEPDSEGNVEAIWIVWEQKPLIVADTGGRVHAFWQDRGDAFRPEIKRILHSELRIGATTWTAPMVVARAALTFRVEPDPQGGLLLTFIRNEQSAAQPAGIYIRRRGANAWGEQTLVYTTRYFRGLQPEQVHLALTVDAQNTAYLSWDDPRLGQALLTLSRDGNVWSTPLPVGEGDTDTAPTRARILSGPAGQTLLLWQDSRAACALYQQLSADNGATWGERERILTSLRDCAQPMMTLQTPDGQALLVAGSGLSALTLAVWDGERWSELQTLSFNFEDPLLQRRVYLEKLQLILRGNRLVVVGQGQDKEAWVLESPLEVVEWAFAPPPIWSTPANVSRSTGTPGLPSTVMDAEGRVHVLWSETPTSGTTATALYYAVWSGESWSRAAAVLRSPQGRAEEPLLTVLNQQLHAVWAGNGGQIFYSRAFVRDAYATGAWSEPALLSGFALAADKPKIVADLGGNLHVVYVTPLNEGRGVYYTRSEDAGESWSQPALIFDAVEARVAMVEHPTLAVDELGVIHVAWVRAPLPGIGPPEAIEYIRSEDSGETWSLPFLVAEGAFDWPQLRATLTGQVHLMWAEARGTRARFHRWQDVNAREWSFQARIAGFEGLDGPLGWVADDAGGFYLATMGHDDAFQPALLATRWEGTRWGEREVYRTGGAGFTGAMGAALSYQPTNGQLAVVYRGTMLNEAGAEQLDVFAMHRAVPVVTTQPVWQVTPEPTPEPTLEATPMPTPTPRPLVDLSAPQTGTPMLALGPVTLPITAVGGVGFALVVVVGLILAQTRKR